VQKLGPCQLGSELGSIAGDRGDSDARLMSRTRGQTRDRGIGRANAVILEWCRRGGCRRLRIQVCFGWWRPRGSVPGADRVDHGPSQFETTPRSA